MATGVEREAVAGPECDRAIAVIAADCCRDDVRLVLPVESTNCKVLAVRERVGCVCAVGAGCG